MTNHRFPDDPYKDREQEKYEQPIPSREFILALLEKQEKPLTFGELYTELSLSAHEKTPLKRRLKAMCRDGQLMMDRKGRYGPIDKLDLVKGTVLGHRDGYGFLRCEDERDDVFITAMDMQSLLHGDKVLARVSELHNGRAEARIVEVLERSVKHIVGQLFFENTLAYVTPDNRQFTHDIIIPPEGMTDASEGQMVVVEIIHYPNKHMPAMGRIVKVLGDYLAPGIEIDVAIHAHHIPHEWSEAVVQETAKIPNEVSAADREGRVDLRHLSLVTIDGEDAKDFDDAVFAETLPEGGWRLIVAIADVSHYVMPDTFLDQSARERGNSVYFPGRVVPMLPEQLSNGICSLKPKVDRLCVVCDMRFDAKGKRIHSEFYNAVMHSHMRFTYTQVAAILAGDAYQLITEHAALLPSLYALNELYHQLLKLRHKRGALEFESTETKIVFGPKKKIERIEAVSRNIAHRLIEECMLAANVAASELAERNRLPILYRNHEPPPFERVEELRTFLGEFGLDLKGKEQPSPLDYAHLLKDISERREHHMMQMVVLRSMTQAVYSPINEGHFGLAYTAYTHFTSPIRRYPDLMLHRAIKGHLASNNSKRQPKQVGESGENWLALGHHCSMTERRADEATREVVSWLKCEFMQTKVGEEYDGLVTGVASFGLFVELQDMYVEGLVHVTALNGDYYHYDNTGHRLIGEHTRTTYRLGDKVRIKVAQVNLDTKKIDFQLVIKEKNKKVTTQNKSTQEKSKRRKKKKSS